MMIYGMASRGTGKIECEDSMLIGNTIVSEGYFEWKSDSRFTVAIADGVGGNKAGAEASYRAVRGIRESKLFQGCTLDYLDSLIGEINQNIVSVSKSNPEFDRMATTLSGIYCDPNKTLLYHVGNTRVYCINGIYLKQLTTDQTNVNFWVMQGMMTKQEAEQHPRKNEIYACLGAGDTKIGDRRIVKDISDLVKTNSDLILTTDGVHDYMSIDDMENAFNTAMPIKSKLEYLIQKARENGSQDDISVIYLKSEEALL